MSPSKPFTQNHFSLRYLSKRERVAGSPQAHAPRHLNWDLILKHGVVAVNGIMHQLSITVLPSIAQVPLLPGSMLFLFVLHLVPKRWGGGDYVTKTWGIDEALEQTA